MSELMRGGTRVRQHVATFLQEAMPPILAAARQEWNREPWQLPTPVRYDAYDPLTAHEYPTIGSVVRRTTNWSRTEVLSDGSHEHRARYSMLLFLWVATPIDLNGDPEDENTYDTTLRLRDDMLGLMRSVLLQTPSLRSNGRIMMEENSLSEDYLDAIDVSKESNMWLAGGTITCDLVVAEHTSNVKIGMVETIQVEGNMLEQSIQQ